MTHTKLLSGLLMGLAFGAAHAGEAPAALRPDQAAFREIYRELVETNTTLSAGSCTLAAERMAAHLKRAGYPDADVQVIVHPEHPKEGSLFAQLRGSDAKAGAILLLGHLDVVEARREDWTRDPFTLVEENGFFYGRGTADMKGLDAVWVDTLVRLKKAGKPPRRTLKLALTCGEETVEAFNGADWLVKNRGELIAADYVLNESGGGRFLEDGTRELVSVQVGEKMNQSFLLTVTNPGGHSSRPLPDNAIYRLGEALQKVRGYVFPVKLTDVTRATFTIRAQQGDAVGEALKKLLANPADAEAARAAEKDPNVNAVLHTNCVATLLAAGHASNALPQRATANMNCRIFPGETVEGTRDTLIRVIGDPAVQVDVVQPVRPLATQPGLDPKVIDPMRKLASKYFPKVPFVPTMSAGATDGRYFGPSGMPVYGVAGIFGESDGNGTHGLNERLRASALYEGRDYLYELLGEYLRAR